MKHLFRIYILVFMLTSDFKIFAQPGSGGGVEDNDELPPPSAPINSKIIVLLLFGLLFGIYKLRMRKATT